MYSLGSRLLHVQFLCFVDPYFSSESSIRPISPGSKGCICLLRNHWPRAKEKIRCRDVASLRQGFKEVTIICDPTWQLVP